MTIIDTVPEPCHPTQCVEAIQRAMKSREKRLESETINKDIMEAAMLKLFVDSAK